MRIVVASLALLVAACTQAAPPGDTGSAGPADAETNDEVEGVERLHGADRVMTAVAVSVRFWRSSPRVVLAGAGTFPDALAGAALAVRLGAPILLTDRARLPAAVGGELERLGAESVVVVGGERAVGAAVEDELRGMGLDVRRVAGADRYDTAGRVVAELGGPDEVVLASGEAFPDALAAAPAPVLLTARDELPPATAAALDAVHAVTIVGGPGAVSLAVEREVRERGITVSRVAGSDRYATAAAMFESSLRPGEAVPVVVAGGEGFADALAAGPVAGLLGAGLVLAPPARLTDDVDALLRRADVAAAILVGGRAAVGPHVESELVAALEGAPRPTATVVTARGFLGTASPLPEEVRARMSEVSWRAGCPVSLDGLAYLRLDHVDFQGSPRQGELVVAADAAEPVLHVFAALYDVEFPIAQVRLVDEFDGDDAASMEANNTSGFNCRPVVGGSRWSEHAYGTAVDLNPVQNPYRRGDVVLPEAGRAYLDRGDVRAGMIVRAGPVVDAFARIGWGWGGDWSGLDDWMHFSASGS